MANRHNHHIHTLRICASIVLGLMMMPLAVSADDYSLLQGFWKCQEEGIQTTIDFQSREQLLYNGEAARFQLMPNVIRVMEEYGPVDYFYQYQQKTLTIFSPDGSVTQCRKSKKPAQQAQKNVPKTGPSPGPKSGKALMPGPDWPRYERPAGQVSLETSDPQALLYKFAGRWDRASTNTLTNLYLKPDGTFEESYESGYSGDFKDQGGYQTGAWGTAGSEQSQGRWMIEGTIKQGVLTLIDQNGNRTAYNYQVHYENGEYYGGEYFFNGQLYSVKYIYR